MPGMVYQWRPKTMIPLDAQQTGEHLEMLRGKSGGELTPQIVVADARHNNSPLHAGFEWDDEKAAEIYRVDRARHIIGSLSVSVQSSPVEEPKSMRAFVSVTKQDRPSYTSLEAAMSDADLRSQIVERAWNELLSWKSRYEEYKELAAVASAIDREAVKRRAG